MSDSDNWYIVDTAGDTQGPMGENALVRLYLNETIHSKTYIWDGASVPEWTALMNVPSLFGTIRQRYGLHHGHTLSSAERSRAEDPCDSQTDADTVSTREHPPLISTSNDFATSEQQRRDIDEEKTESGQHPRYPQKLQFLKSSSDRLDLMENLRNGIRLRNQKATELEQNESNLPPKRLRDDFAPSQRTERQGDNAEQLAKFIHSDFANTSPDSKHIRQPYDHRKDWKAINHELANGLDALKISTSAKHDHSSSERDHSSSERSRTTSTQHPTKVLFSDEVADRLSAIRKKFGQVEEVTSRKGSVQQNKRYTKPQSNEHSYDRKPQTNEHSYDRDSQESAGTTKSRNIARRIAKLKDKLDQLTDKESWLITRVENILLTANK